MSGLIKFIVLLSISASSFAKEHTNELLYAFKDNKYKSSDNIVEKIQINNKSFASKNIYQVRREMLATGLFKFVELNTIEREASSLPTEADLGAAWHHENIKTKEAWSLIKSTTPVVVAVCDSGYEAQHPDLRGKTVPGYNFDGGNEDTSPNTHHGTMVAGIITGEVSQTVRTSGIAPNTKIMPLKITSTKGSTSLSTIVDCIKYASDNGAKVINVSFTGVQNKSIQAAGEYANSKGALLVYSAGNQGKRRKLNKYPDHKNVFIVGGTQKNNKRWNCSSWVKKCGSNYGYFIDVVAPGKSVLVPKAYVTKGGKAYKFANGTSFSAPIVSAVAALVFSVNPKLTPQEVEGILKESASNIGSNYVYGEGLINAQKAVELALKSK